MVSLSEVSENTVLQHHAVSLKNKEKKLSWAQEGEERRASGQHMLLGAKRLQAVHFTRKMSMLPKKCLQKCMTWCPVISKLLTGLTFVTGEDNHG